MRYAFIINPAAGKGIAVKKLVTEIAEYCSLRKTEYSVQITTAPGDAKRFACEHAQKGDEVTVFLAGGEGTVFEALNGVMGYDNVTLAVIPIGSANDFLKFFPKNKKLAFRDIHDQIMGKPIKMDVIKAGEYYCLNGCSAGMDAMVAKYMSDFKKIPLINGTMAYNLAIVKCFLGKIGCRLNLKADGKDLGNKECLFAVVANGPAYGGGYLAAKEAVPFDGELNFTIVEKVSKLKILRFIGKYRKGDVDSLPFVHKEKCQRFSVCSSEPVPINLDGEITETKKMDFRIVKSAVKFLIPASIANKLLIN